MIEAIRSLRSILERECDIYEELLSLSIQQRDALVQRDVNTLISNSSREVKLSTYNSSIEIMCKDSMAKLVSQLGLAPDSLSLSAIIKCLPEEEAKPLKEIQSRMLHTASELIKVNRINSLLFESALDLVRFTVKLLADTKQGSEPCYPTRETPSQCNSIMVDIRA